MAGEGRTRDRRGHELLAAVCFDQCWSRMFPWVKGIRLGTEEEDRQGKDLVIETADLGDFPVQVKSSTKFLKKHFSRYPDIPVLVIFPTHTEEEVRKRLAKLVKAERARRDPSYRVSSEGIGQRETERPPSQPMRATLGELLSRK